MIESEKKLKELNSRLHDRNVSVIIESLKSLRNNEPFVGAIRVLSETYDLSENQVVKELIRNFMNDIKESGARPEVITEITKNYKPSTIGMLVSSCWQSGLDYSAYAADLAHIFLNYDYSVAIECFTVLEESSPRISKKNKDEIILFLKENEGHVSKEKTALLSELITVLS
jgi:hypothetical protein